MCMCISASTTTTCVTRDVAHENDPALSRHDAFSARAQAAAHLAPGLTPVPGASCTLRATADARLPWVAGVDPAGRRRLADPRSNEVLFTEGGSTARAPPAARNLEFTCTTSGPVCLRASPHRPGCTRCCCRASMNLTTRALPLPLVAAVPVLSAGPPLLPAVKHKCARCVCLSAFVCQRLTPAASTTAEAPVNAASHLQRTSHHHGNLAAAKHCLLLAAAAFACFPPNAEISADAWRALWQAAGRQGQTHLWCVQNKITLNGQ